MSLLVQVATQSDLQAGMAEAGSWLSLTERARLASLRSEARQRGFLAGRWLARLTVRQWCGVDGLPELSVAHSGACHVANQAGVYVSISHSGEHVACAVAAMPVGVDVERLEQPRDYLAMARVVHSTEQQKLLNQLPPSEQPGGFLRFWTLKEAWLKAREQSLDFALMRSLEFVGDQHGDSAVVEVGELVLAVATEAELPAIVGVEPRQSWRRYQSRCLALG